MPKNKTPLTEISQRERRRIFKHAPISLKFTMYASGFFGGDYGKQPLKPPPRGTAAAIEKDWQQSAIAQKIAENKRGASHESSDSMSSGSKTVRYDHTRNAPTDLQVHQGGHPNKKVSTSKKLKNYLETTGMSSYEKVNGWQNSDNTHRETHRPPVTAGKKSTNPHAFYQKKPATAHHSKQNRQDARADASSYTSSGASR